MTYYDHTGKKYGNLIIVEQVDNDKHGHTRWLAVCTCGTETIVWGNHLKSGHKQSCGAGYHMPNVLPVGEASFRRLFRGMKRDAKRRNYEWKLSRAQVRGLTKENCHYCNTEPAQIVSGKRVNGSYVYNGIDRVDNTKGYTPENVVPCCKACNYAKRDMSFGEFTTWILDVYNNLLEYAEEVI